MMEGQREICCCGSYSWTKVIAWIQIVYYSVPTILLSLVLVLFMAEPEAFMKVWNDPTHDQMDRFPFGEDDPYAKIMLKLHPLVVILILALVLIPNVIMGIVLLVGANKKSIRHLMAWTIYGGVCVVMQICQLSLGTPVYIFGSLLVIGVYAFEIWVVQLFRREIENGLHGDNGRVIGYMPTTTGLDGGLKLLEAQRQEWNYNKV